MQPTKEDLLVLVYNYALVLSGGYFAFSFDVPDRFVLLGVSLALALFWTVYFKLVMVSKLFPEDAEADDGEGDTTPADP